jgi:hypothetical protein
MREPMTITLGGGGAFSFGYHLGLSRACVTKGRHCQCAVVGDFW